MIRTGTARTVQYSASRCRVCRYVPSSPVPFHVAVRTQQGAAVRRSPRVTTQRCQRFGSFVRSDPFACMRGPHAMQAGTAAERNGTASGFSGTVYRDPTSWLGRHRPPLDFSCQADTSRHPMPRRHLQVPVLVTRESTS